MRMKMRARSDAHDLLLSKFVFEGGEISEFNHSNLILSFARRFVLLDDAFYAYTHKSHVRLCSPK